MHLYELFLLEYKRDITASKYGNGILSNARKDEWVMQKLSASNLKTENEQIDGLLDLIEKMDPTRNKKYVLWLIHQYLAKKFRFEDSDRVLDVLQRYVRFLPQFKRLGKNPDLNKYDFHSLENLMDELSGTTIDTETNVATSDFKVFYDGPLGQMVSPNTTKGAAEIAKGTKWCTGDVNTAYYYMSSGPLYVWKDRDGKKYQFHFDSCQFMDAQDRPLPADKLAYFRTKHPITSQIFKINEQRFIDEGRRKPHRLYEYIKDIGFQEFGRVEEVKKCFMTNANYAIHIMRAYGMTRWPEAEPYIKRNAEVAYEYANDFLKTRWVAAEPQIVLYPEVAYWYAKDVIKGPWPEAEPKIMRDPNIAHKYARHVIKGPWPEAGINVEYPCMDELPEIRSLNEMDEAYQEFLKSTGYPKMSADELEHLLSHKLSELTEGDDEEKIKYDTKWVHFFVWKYNELEDSEYENEDYDSDDDL